jgi:hypothetical protein
MTNKDKVVNSFHDFTVQELRMIVKAYNLSTKVIIHGRNKSQIVSDLENHLQIHDNKKTLKFKPKEKPINLKTAKDSYKKAQAERKLKKENKKKAVEEAKKKAEEEAKKKADEEAKKKAESEAKKKEIKEVNPRDKVIENYNYLVNLDDKWLKKADYYEADEDFKKLINVIEKNKEYNLGLDLSKIGYPIMDWIEYNRARSAKSSVINQKLMDLVDIKNYISKKPEWIKDKLKEDYKYLVNPGDFGNQEPDKIGRDLGLIRLIDRGNKKYNLKLDLSKVGELIKLLIGNDKKYTDEELQKITKVKPGYKNARYYFLAREGSYEV